MDDAGIGRRRTPSTHGLFDIHFSSNIYFEVTNPHTVGSLTIPRASIKWVYLWELSLTRNESQKGREWRGSLVDLHTNRVRHGSAACLVIYDVAELKFHSKNEHAQKELELYHYKCLSALNTSTGPRLCAFCDCYESGDFNPFDVRFHTCESVPPCPGCPAEYPTELYCDSECRRLHRDSHRCKYVCFNIGLRSRRSG